jgi:DNA-directed RNA polymerase specialized sigma24 family protein
MASPFEDSADVDLAKAARGGDEAARDRLLEAYRDALFTCVVRIAGDRRRSEAALRDGFVDWVRALNKSLPSSGIRVSLYRMAVRAGRKALTGRGPGQGASPRVLAELAAELRSCGAEVPPRDRSSELQWLLRILSARSRELLVLIEVMGLSDDQAGVILGMKPAAVPEALQRATDELSRADKDHGVPAPTGETASANPRAELHLLGWETAPWHFSPSLQQAILRDRDRRLRLRSKPLLVGVAVLLGLLLAWALL